MSKMKAKNCARCGEAFETQWSHSVYCSIECYNRTNYAKYAARRREKREAVERMTGMLREVVCKPWR